MTTKDCSACRLDSRSVFLDCQSRYLVILSAYTDCLFGCLVSSFRQRECLSSCLENLFRLLGVWALCSAVKTLLRYSRFVCVNVGRAIYILQSDCLGNLSVDYFLFWVPTRFV